MSRLKVLLMSSMAVLALSAVSAVAAQAATIGPANESFVATSTNSSLSYEGAKVSCTLSTAEGITTNPASMNAELSLLQFGTPGPGENCNSSLLEVVGIETSEFPSPGWTLTAINAVGGGSGEGVITIPSGGEAVVKVGFKPSTTLCTLRVKGEQSIPVFFDASSQELSVGELMPTPESNNVNVVTEGLCPGSGSGTGTFSATYSVSSASGLEIN